MVGEKGFDDTEEVRLELTRESEAVVIDFLPGSSHFLYSDYIIPQFLKNVKRVLNIFYGSFEIPEITL